MKTLTICKGCHYSNEMPCVKFWCKSYDRIEKRQYVFTESCRYDIGTDQTDKNKLFGWSYGHHQNNSVRCTWWYNDIDDTIRLCLYVYCNGKLHKTDVPDKFKINEVIDIELTSEYHIENGQMTYSLKSCSSSTTERTVTSVCEVGKLPRWGYTLTLYFGGNERAPHKMHVRKETL